MEVGEFTWELSSDDEENGDNDCSSESSADGSVDSGGGFGACTTTWMWNGVSSCIVSTPTKRW